jgi:hypothetical protein
MVQHFPYEPPAYASYYFRPYSVAGLNYQRRIVASWGEDPRTPYANAIFQRVYRELDADRSNAVPEDDEDDMVEEDEAEEAEEVPPEAEPDDMTAEPK